MAFLKKLTNFFSTTKQNSRPTHIISARCNRCGEILTARIDLNNELSRADGGGFIVRKTLMGNGENRCFQRVEITLHFDDKRTVTDREIVGGTFQMTNGE